MDVILCIVLTLKSRVKITAVVYRGTFITSDPGMMQIFIYYTTAINSLLKKAGVFGTVGHFHPSLMFAGILNSCSLAPLTELSPLTTWLPRRPRLIFVV